MVTDRGAELRIGLQALVGGEAEMSGPRAALDLVRCSLFPEIQEREHPRSFGKGSSPAVLLREAIRSSGNINRMTHSYTT